MTHDWFLWRGESLVLRVRVQPRSKTESIDGVHAGRLKVRLPAPPVDSKANRALIALMAEQFSVRNKNVKILYGLANRDKTVSIESPRCSPDWFATLGGSPVAP